MDDVTATELLRTLSSVDSQERFEAAICLGQRGDRRALQVLNEAIDAGDEAIRWAAEKALSQIVTANAQAKAHKQWMGMLFEQLESADEGQRLQSAEALAQAGVDEGFAVLLNLLRDGRKSTRVMAAACLQEIADPRSIEPLIEALHDGQRDVRRFAASALSVFSDTRSILPLIEALSDPEDGDTRYWAARSLQNIGEPAHPFLLPLQNGEDAALSVLAAAALGRYGNEDTFQILVAACKSRDVGTAAQALANQALAKMDDPRAVDVLVELLIDERADARSTAAWWLGEMGNLRVEGPLTAALTDVDEWVRRNAKEAIDKICRK